MQCRSCGAPLEFIDGRDYFTCRFCEAFQFPTDLEGSADRIKDLQEPGSGSCPTCKERLTQGTLERRAVEFCRNCRGFWVLKESFADVVANRRANFRGADRQVLPIRPEELLQHRPCPGCDQRMEVHPYYGPGGVVIDSCRSCATVWLDHGEIAAIESSPGRRSR